VFAGGRSLENGGCVVHSCGRGGFSIDLWPGRSGFWGWWIHSSLSIGSVFTVLYWAYD